MEYKNYAIDDMDLKVVINPVIAKKLLQQGFPVLDIKEKKGNVGSASVFLFENTEAFRAALQKLLSK